MPEIKVKSVDNGFECVAIGEACPRCMRKDCVLLGREDTYVGALHQALYQLNSLAEQVRHRLKVYRRGG